MPDLWLCSFSQSDPGATTRTIFPRRRAWVDWLKLLAASLANSRFGPHAVCVALTRTVFCPLVAIVISSRELFSALLALKSRCPAFPKMVLLSTDVLSNMRTPCNDNKVFEPVVRFVTVDVVHNLAVRKWSSKVIAHYKAVFGHVSLASKNCVGVIRRENVNVAAFIGAFSASPIWVSSSFSHSRHPIMSDKCIIPCVTHLCKLEVRFA